MDERTRELIRRFDEALEEGKRWHERQMSGEDPDESRVSMTVGLGGLPPPDLALPRLRALLIREVLSSRTLADIAKSRGLIREWLTLFEDLEVESYGAYLARMEGALRRIDDG